MKVKVWVLLYSAVLLLLPMGLPPVYGETTCLSGGCHGALLRAKYIHGPVAAEQLQPGNCTMCHLPDGAECTSAAAGRFSLNNGKKLCLTCHGGGTGTLHSDTKVMCLSCHDPHGSETSPYFVRPGTNMHQ